MRLFRRSRLEAELEDELRSHIQHRADDLERTGVSRAEAERRARVEFGAYQRVREDTRDAGGGTFLESVWQDLRYATRVLRKSKGFTAVAVVTLALGIGANAVVFGVLNALVLQPMNLPQERSLYSVEQGDNGFGSYADYLDMRDQNRSFENLAAFCVTAAAVDTGGNPLRAWGFEVTGNYFDALGIQPALGRLFHAADEHGPNSAPYVVLTHAYWRSRFQEDPSVIGRTVEVNRQPYTIIGVTPPEFHGTLLFFPPEFFVPIVNHDQLNSEQVMNVRSNRWVMEVLGHVKAGVSPAQATEDLNAISVYLANTYPKDDGKMIFSLARPSLFGNFLGRPIRGFMTGLMLLAGLILLAACANLGSLFAARAADRSREVALRLALGASRARILRQLFTESVLLSIAGGAVGLAASLVAASSAWSLAAVFALPRARPGGARRHGVRRGAGPRTGERPALRRRANTTGAAHQSVRDREIRLDRQGRTPAHGARRVARRANRDLRRARDLVVRRRARAAPDAAQQLRVRAAARAAHQSRAADGRLQRRSHARHAPADDRCPGIDRGRRVRRVSG